MSKRLHTYYHFVSNIFCGVSVNETPEHCNSERRLKDFSDVGAVSSKYALNSVTFP
jgi:hypothetical protein